MKVFLDDIREAPPGWRRTYTPDETIELLETGLVTDLSLNHDLGDENSVGTGYDVTRWIENQVIRNGFTPPLTTIHSENPAGRFRMEEAIAAIWRHFIRHDDGQRDGNVSGD